MNQRSLKLLEIRPLVGAARILPDIGTEERFQNQTLRPILKLQNDLLIASFQNYIVKGKNKFHELKKEARLDYISNALKKDLKYRNTVKGMILGQFTLEEYSAYSADASAFNKRITSMAIKRLQDQLQVFEDAGLIQ
ncbi:glyoxalase [Maribacter chungangensis]|uniref:Glyoxalase n=1 Tax=Maribacter chungangensis TaxID=1069117 RepID=A0ABW3B313_9FLAO